MLFFSATYDQEVMTFADHIVSNPIIIRFVYLVEIYLYDNDFK